MRKINWLLFILLLCAGKAYSQHVYQIRADSVRIYNVCDTAELIIENRTRGVSGYLYNKGNGRTEFRRIRLESIGGNQIAISGQDTLDISTLSGMGGVDTIYRSGDNILYKKNGTVHTVYAPLPSYKTIPAGTSYAASDFPASRITGFSAYDSPDMPVVSDQALTNGGSGNKYYAGHVAWNGSAGYQMIVNWDGELTGPKGVFVRNKDDTETTWGAWRELVFKDYADGKYWHAGNHAPGIATSPVLTGANVPGSFTTNASGHVTGFTTRTLTAADIAAAPSSGSGNYIQKQISAAQGSSDFWLSGTGRANGDFQVVKTGSDEFSQSFWLLDGSLNKGANFQLNGDATPGLSAWLNNGSSWLERMRISATDGRTDFFGKFFGSSLSGIRGTATGITNTSALGFYESNGTTRNGYIGKAATNNNDIYIWSDNGGIVLAGDYTTITGIPALPTPASTFLTTVSGKVQSRTASQVRSDIGAAPASGSSNYLINQTGSAQAGAGAWTAGLLQAGNGIITRKNGSNEYYNGLALHNFDGNRGVSFQLNEDATPGLATWLHNGSDWVKRMELRASGTMLLNGAADDGESKLIANGAIRAGTGTTGNVRLFPGSASAAGFLSIYNGSNNRLGYIGYDNVNLAYVTDGNAAHRFFAGGSERMHINSVSVAVDGILSQKRNAVNPANDAGNQLWNSLGGSNLYPDPEFGLGFNSLIPYNNAGGTAVQLFRENTASLAPPNYSGYYVRVQIRPGTSSGTIPGLGGFTTHLSTTVNQVYVTRIRAKIPAGYNIQFAANAFGNNSEAVWLTDRSGNGKWKDYMLMWRTGNSGTFSSVNYFYIEGAAADIDVYVSYFDTKNTNASHWTDNVQVNHSTARPASIYLNNNSTYISQGANTSVRAGTAHGYVEIGPQNGDFAHFSTDRGRFHFNKELYGTSKISIYNGGLNPTTFMQQNEMRVNNNPVWHAGNITFATKGANIGLKTEANGYLGLDSWIRVADGTGLFTTSGKYFYNNAIASWALRSATGQTAAWLELQTGEGTNRGGLYANSSNDVGIVNANGTGWRLRTDANGNAYVTGQVQATSFYQSSLRSLKMNILPFTASALSILGNAQVRSFQFKADKTGKTNIGFIADEVPDEMSIPGRTGVDQASTVALLVKSVQELHKENEELRAEITELKALMKEIVNNK